MPIAIQSTVTQKGQVTIPKKFREKLGIGVYEKVNIEAKKDHLKITPVVDILELAGKYYAPKGKNALKAREEMAKNYKRF